MVLAHARPSDVAANKAACKPGLETCELDVQLPAGPVNPSFRALSGVFKFTVRRDKFNEDAVSGLVVWVGNSVGNSDEVEDSDFW